MHLNISDHARQRLISILLGVCVGSGVASVICSIGLRQVNKINENMVQNHNLVVDIFMKMEGAMTDVTLSASEKEAKVEELKKFLEIVFERDFN